MPLIKSTKKEAFAKNVKREIAAGKPPKQAVAIAYSVKRAAHGTEHHSSHSARRSEDYHKMVVGQKVKPSANKMTRAEGVRGKDQEDRWV